jgi:hypothetical protein
MDSSGIVQSRTFDVRCKDGGTKTICFNPVTLGDGTQYVTCEDKTAGR